MPRPQKPIAGGIQATALQLGGVIGTSVLGSILTSQVGSTLVGNLQAAGVPTPLARRFLAAKQLVAQGLAPHVPGAPAPLQAAFTTASHQAFISGLHLALAVAAGVCLVTAVLGAFVERPACDIEALSEEDRRQPLQRRPA